MLFRSMCVSPFFPPVDVSIHAPIRVRPAGLGMMPVQETFQSTHPYGCDLEIQRPVRSGDVSIHAPIRVRLSDLVATFIVHGVSIHAPIRVRPLAVGPLTTQDVFQSTHPYGCD